MSKVLKKTTCLFILTIILFSPSWLKAQEQEAQEQEAQQEENAFSIDLSENENELENELKNEIDYSKPLPEEFFKAKVKKVIEEGPINEDYEAHYFQTLLLEFIDGSEEGREEIVTTTGLYPKASPGQLLKVGDTVVVSKMINYEGENIYRLVDRYRLKALIWIALFFVALSIWLGKLRGASSLVGLAFSILVLALYIVPQILDGKNPFLIILAGSTVIASVSIYLAHGFRKQTSIALLATIITLGIAIGLSVIFVFFSKLFGFGSEDAYFVIAARESINLRGLLIGGIIIGTLGVLDDITTAQTAVVAELKKANRSLSRFELYKRGLAVGHEHIAALINTLVLAYAGASLPIFLLFTLNEYQPIWTIFNSEFVAEEIIRTLVGSSALILAVPISTFLAAYFLSKPGVLPEELEGGHKH